MSLLIAATDPYDPIVATLVDELSQELSRRYGDICTGRFQVSDVAVPRAVFLVAYEDHAPVGCGALRPVDETTAEVKRMYVRPSVRGQGISRQILSSLEQQARQFGYHRLVLTTGRPQIEAIHLYDTSGYHRIAGYGAHTTGEVDLCFEKWLVPANAED